MDTSDAENLTNETARPSSMSVDARATKGDATEEGSDEARGGHVETESEDENPEATRRYWEMKRKKEGIYKVSVVCRDA
jgi:hypothetical protein